MLRLYTRDVARLRFIIFLYHFRLASITPKKPAPRRRGDKEYRHGIRLPLFSQNYDIDARLPLRLGSDSRDAPCRMSHVRRGHLPRRGILTYALCRAMLTTDAAKAPAFVVDDISQRMPLFTSTTLDFSAARRLMPFYTAGN